MNKKWANCFPQMDRAADVHAHACLLGIVVVPWRTAKVARRANALIGSEGAPFSFRERAEAIQKPTLFLRDSNPRSVC